MSAHNQANVTLDDLALYFHLPISEAAKKIGICTTVIKKICRRYGIPRWPQRKLAAILKRISSLERELQFQPQPERRYEIEVQLRALLEDRQAILEGRVVDTHFSPRDDVTRKRKATDDMDMDVLLPQLQFGQQGHFHHQHSSAEEIDESPRDTMDIVGSTGTPRLPGFRILLEAIDSVESKDHNAMYSAKRRRLNLDVHRPVAMQPLQFAPVSNVPSIQHMGLPMSQFSQENLSPSHMSPFNSHPAMSPQSMFMGTYDSMHTTPYFDAMSSGLPPSPTMSVPAYHSPTMFSMSSSGNTFEYPRFQTSYMETQRPYFAQ